MTTADDEVELTYTRVVPEFVDDHDLWQRDPGRPTDSTGETDRST